MKTLFAIAAVLGLLAGHALGQGAQADQIKRRAKELSNQNNVRQGVPSPAQPAARRTPTGAKPPAASASTAQPQGLAKLQADLAGLKPGSPATAAQKQQLINDVIAACRGTKPSSSGITAFVNDLTASLAEKPLEPAQQMRLAEDIEATLNSAAMPSAQFDAIIADVQAILQVTGSKRNLAISAANRLKAVGVEVRRGSAQ